MKTIQKRFSALGLMLTVIVVLGLILQYFYLNNIITREKQKLIVSSREYLAADINEQIRYYSQLVHISGNFIEMIDWTEEEVIAFMNKFVENNELIKLIYYGDINNKLINNDDWKPPNGYDLRTRPWYIKAIKENKLIVSDVYEDSKDGEMVVSISKPVYDKDGHLMGVVAADIIMAEIIKTVEESRVQGTGYSFLIDGIGNIMVRPEYKTKSGLMNIDSLGTKIYDEIKNIKKGQLKVTFDGVPGYLFYMPIENTDWTTGNFVPLKDLRGNTSEIWRMFLIALFISITIFGSFNWLQGKIYLKPLMKFGQDIKRIDLENNMAYRLSVEDKDPFIYVRNMLNTILNKQQELFEQVERDKKVMWEKNNKLNYLSYNDQLTGLYNRRYFEQELHRLDLEANLPIALVMGDANGLKLINDAFGHKAGDDLLIAIANIIKQSCRVNDIVCRISGDEFVIILPRTNLKEAGRILERIKELTKDKRLTSGRFDNIGISASYGIGIKENINMDILDTLKIAEENMYSNKLFEGPNIRTQIIETIIEQLYRDDQSKQAHAKEVARISRKLGQVLGLELDELDELEKAAEIHDIGEITISEAILYKNGPLSPEGWMEVKKHPEIGYRILNTVSEMSRIAEYILYHHERYDGSGYPKGLKGNDIPLESRIIALAGAYDAMKTDRPYREALSTEEIIQEFITNSGTQFDPELTQIFIEKILTPANK